MNNYRTVYLMGLDEIPLDNLKELEKEFSCQIKRANKIPEKADLLVLDSSVIKKDTISEIKNKNIPYIVICECNEEEVRSIINSGAIDFLTKDKEKNYIKIFPDYLKHILSQLVKQFYAEKQVFSKWSEYALFGIYVFGEDLKFRYVNPGFLKILGYTADELYKQHNALSIIYPEDREMTREKIIERFEGREKIVEYPNRFVHKNGDVKWVYIKGFVTNFDGEKVIIGTVSDITEIKKYQEELEKEKAELEETLRESIYAINKIFEVRDPYTSSHQIRVAEIAEKVAKELNFNEKSLKEILWAGLLHDIGKIAIPSDILSKPSKLNDIEYSLIRLHPITGYNILKEIHQVGKIAEIVYQHHERLDGSGYPRGLKKDNIIFEAKLLATIDVIEAMGSHRPYRAARKVEEILEELNSGRGKKYEPIIVDKVIELMKKGEIIITPKG